MRACEGAECIAPLLTSVLGSVICELHAPATLPLGKEAQLPIL
jgi:hypothetical protein